MTIPRTREVISGSVGNANIPKINSGKHKKNNPMNIIYMPKIKSDNAALLISLNNSKIHAPIT
jgi:hypothetical protein